MRADTAQVTAKKPDWSGAKAPISLKPRPDQSTTDAAPKPAVAASVWNINVDDDEELLDDDELLTEEDKLRPAPVGKCAFT